MIKKKEVFKFTDEDGVELELAILKPSPKIETEAQKVYNREWTAAVANDKAIVRAKMWDILEEQGLWTKKEDEELKVLQKDLFEIVEKLRLEGNGFSTLSEAKEAAIAAKEKRSKIYELASRRNSLDAMTAEGRADSARLNYLISACTVYNNDSRPYFKSVDEYIDKADTAVGVVAATKFLTFVNEVDTDWFSKLPENTFLKKYGLEDKEGESEDLPKLEPKPFVDAEGNEIKPIVVEILEKFV